MNKIGRLHESIRALFRSEGEKFCYTPGEIERLVCRAFIIKRNASSSIVIGSASSDSVTPSAWRSPLAAQNRA